MLVVQENDDKSPGQGQGTFSGLPGQPSVWECGGHSPKCPESPPYVVLAHIAPGLVT